VVLETRNPFQLTLSVRDTLRLHLETRIVCRLASLKLGAGRNKGLIFPSSFGTKEEEVGSFLKIL